MQTISTRLTAIAVLAALLGACSDSTDDAQFAADQTARAVQVIAEPLVFEHARTSIEAVGTSRAILSAELHPAAAGEVVAVNFNPGQFVRKGDVLVELDSREEKLAVELAEITLEDATRLHDRYLRSADSGAVLPTALDAARTAMEAARVELQQARIALADRSIRAVFDGHVGTSEIDPGDRVNPETMITTLDDRSSLLVSFEIPEAYLGQFDAGDSIRLETWSASIPAVDGEIVDIGSRIDPRNRAFVARARVQNSDDVLRPGMSFRVNANLEGARYAVVPETAVLWGAEGAYIWSLVDAVATRTPVQVIQRRAGRVLVDGNLDSVDTIVVEGTQRMRNGVTVDYDRQRVAKARSEAAGSAGGDPGRFSEND
ncbi:MAG: efflux RND transporter periplasmic adaptor subunit [Woeseiaceae bacterium]